MAITQTLWTRTLSPEVGDLPPDVARYFLSLGLTAEDNERYQVLASMEHFDRTYEQQAELENLVHINTVIMLLQAKACFSLKRWQAIC